jgi:serine protease DegS
MNKLFNYIFWPALAGLVFALVIMELPRVADFMIQGDTAQEEPVAPPAPEVFPRSFSDAIQKVMPAVVTINLQQMLAESDNPQDLSNSFSSLANLQIRDFNENNSLGSGVIITADGFLVTSYHIFISPDTGVVNFPETITATLRDGRTVNARPLLYDEASDLALLKIDSPNITHVEPYELNDQEVGDLVIAIGNPRNLGLSASQGIISAIYNTENSHLIQTDAAINPGYSGGALIDFDGNLIGINSNILSESGGSEGLGFATHASMISRLLDYYNASGPGGYLGVSDAEYFSMNEGMLLFGQRIEGLRVLSLVEDGPADLAGLRDGDIITGFNQQKIGTLSNDDELFAAIESISSLGAGEVVEIEVFRDRTYLKISVTLGIGEPFVLFTIQ